jgi:hypothetical protein
MISQTIMDILRKHTRGNWAKPPDEPPIESWMDGDRVCSRFPVFIADSCWTQETDPMVIESSD